MGAFYLSLKARPVPLKVKEHFMQKGFEAPVVSSNENLTALFYPKQAVKTANHISWENYELFVCGTCFYESMKYHDGLVQILKGYASGSFNPLKLSGSYFLLFKYGAEYAFFSDRASVQNIFFHPDAGIISSSFLACLIGAAEASGKQTLNVEALTEILITGNLIGPDTSVKEIMRYEPAIHDNLPGLSRIPGARQNLSDSGVPGFSNQIDHQLGVLKQYFSGLAPVFDELGVASGLTGGFDSRLLFLLLKQKVNNLFVYSTSREQPTLEFLCAKTLAQHYNTELHSPRHNSFKAIDTSGFLQLLHSNFLFNDGQIRTYQLWTEEIKSKPYSASLHSTHKIGMSGVAGEQYRNAELLTRQQYAFDTWFFYEMVYKNCGNPFVDNNLRNEWLNYIRRKIRALLGIDSNLQLITFKEIKRYYNEVYNPATRILRNNIENQLYFFVSPFTEYGVSHEAYKAIPYLGNHHHFQKEMIRRLAPEAAHLSLDYGYTIAEDVPLKYRATAQFKSFAGLRAFNKIYFHGKRNKGLLEEMIKLHPILNRYLSLTDDLNLPLQLERIRESDRLSPLIIQLGFFIHSMGSYLKT